jgi:hypothetical protein
VRQRRWIEQSLLDFNQAADGYSSELPAARPVHLRLLHIRGVKKIPHFVLHPFEFV